MAVAAPKLLAPGSKAREVVLVLTSTLRDRDLIEPDAVQALPAPNALVAASGRDPTTAVADVEGHLLTGLLVDALATAVGPAGCQFPAHLDAGLGISEELRRGMQGRV